MNKTCMRRTTKCQWKVKTLKNWRARLEDSEMLRILPNLIFSFDIIPVKIQAGISPLEIFQMLWERERVCNSHSNLKCKNAAGPTRCPIKAATPTCGFPGMEQRVHTQTGRQVWRRGKGDSVKNLGARWAKHVITEVVTQTLFVNTTLTRVDLTIKILFKVNNRFPTLQTWESDLERPFSNGKIKET